MKESLGNAIKVFFVSTTFICMLSGILGCVFFSGERIGMEGYFSPIIFGGISAILSFVLDVGKERTMSNGEILARQGALLFLIELSVFGLNYIKNHIFSPTVSIILALSIAAIFFMVRMIIFILDKREADDFNETLKNFKEMKG